MDERARQLAERMSEQVHEIAGFLAGLSRLELEAACEDQGAGASVGAVAQHVAAGYGRATMILNAAGSPAPATPAALRPPAPTRASGAAPGKHDHGADDIGATIHRIKAQGVTAVGLISRLTSQALSRPLPKGITRFAEVDKPVSMMIEYMIYRQAGHFDTMKRAVDGHRREAGRARRVVDGDWGILSR